MMTEHRLDTAKKYAVLLFAFGLTLVYLHATNWVMAWWPNFEYIWGIRLFAVIATAFVCLRGWLPRTAFSRPHLPFVGMGMFFLAIELYATSGINFDQLYRSVGYSSMIALLTCIAIFFIYKRADVASQPHSNQSWTWAVLFVFAVLTLFSEHMSYEIKSDALLRSVVTCIITNVFFIGLAEELVFRGVIQGALAMHWKGRIGGFSHANIITALLFTWIHNPSFDLEILPWYLFLFPSGLLFGLMRDKTGSWLAPGIVHAAIIPLVLLIRALDCQFVATCFAK